MTRESTQHGPGRLLHYVLVALMVIPAVALILAVLLVRRWMKVYFFCVPSRIGHMVLEAGLSVIENQAVGTLDGARQDIVMCYQEDPWVTNQVVFSELRKHAQWRPIPRALGVIVMRAIRSIRPLRALEREFHVGGAVDPFYEFDWRRLNILRGTAWNTTEIRSRLGVDSNVPIVAILTRDSAYLRCWGASSNMLTSNEYRNCSISNYLTAMKALVDGGFYVVRVGRNSDEAINPSLENVLDYAHSDLASDVMDFALAAITDVIVTCSSGIDQLYLLHGVPHIGVNIPWLDGRFSHFVTALPKRMFVAEGAAEIELPQLAVTESEFTFVGHVPMWEGKEIRFQENTPNDIEEAVRVGIRMIMDSGFRRERIQLAMPLWERFNDALSHSRMPAGFNTRFPTMGLPDSVMSRFLSV